jgi:hypothetical protein
VAAVITVSSLEGFRPSYNATAGGAIGGLLRFGIFGLLGLVMTDGSTRGGPGNSMSTADLMPGNRTNRSALGGTGGFFIRVARRLRTNRKPHDDSSQKNPSHQKPPFAFRNPTRNNRKRCGGMQ